MDASASVPSLRVSRGGRRRLTVPTRPFQAIRVVAEASGHSIRRPRAGKRCDLPVLHLGREVNKLIMISWVALFHFSDRLEHESSEYDQGHGGCDWWKCPGEVEDPNYKYYFGACCFYFF